MDLKEINELRELVVMAIDPTGGGNRNISVHSAEYMRQSYLSQIYARLVVAAVVMERNEH